MQNREAMHVQTPVKLTVPSQCMHNALCFLLVCTFNWAYYMVKIAGMFQMTRLTVLLATD